MPSALSKKGKTFNLYPWIIVVSGVLVFGLVVFIRLAKSPRPTALESLIAANEPVEHVHSAVTGADGSLYVGVHTGVIHGKGSSWGRLEGVQGDVVAIARAGADTFYLAGPDLGVSRLQGARVEKLLNGDVRVLTAAGTDKLFAYLSGSGIHASPDGGRTWSKLTDPGVGEVLALAADPRNPNTLFAGGMQGGMAFSSDGGKTWSQVDGARLQGSVSSLAFDLRKPERLWAAVGGSVFFSDDQGANWKRVTAREISGRTFVAVAPGPNGAVALTSEGFQFSLPNE